ncbi:hypothetical protein OB2597_20521 [Pseudooceanicola batsensis HTCC2597]|uniref:TIM-barrel domain-containing protein n=1 Tax=Pseudooceanicola batsensis (strain ATCC BAA-863 / DSM 15984 / KCTC 12145 / HTCC2597) TaxID=252305 RepID=A3U164_PSEBH|nr:phosphoenolpyruvate hydrolase family protein [Pseudooceanicola batsensis]EAQ02047.1 hypothetical protein OB2597_20521 [Pseudooceanicola batsensis HTCC2597]
MEHFILSGTPSIPEVPATKTIFCPCLAGLSVTQADLAFVMPRIDHNRSLRETEGAAHWAAVLASDPFGSETTFQTALKAAGYRGIANWPSSILLEGSTRQAMSTIPATPEFEYAYLARAAEAGFETMAFLVSLDQARQAIKAGLSNLVLHPGLRERPDADSAGIFRAALQSIVDAIRREAPQVKILAYTSAQHDRELGLCHLAVDGFIHFQDGAP